MWLRVPGFWSGPGGKWSPRSLLKALLLFEGRQSLGFFAAVDTLLKFFSFQLTRISSGFFSLLPLVDS